MKGLSFGDINAVAVSMHQQVRQEPYMITVDPFSGCVRVCQTRRDYLEYLDERNKMTVEMVRNNR